MLLLFSSIGNAALLQKKENGKFDGYFENETIGEIADLLEKQYGIKVSGQEDSRGDRIALVVNNLSFDHVLKRIFSQYNVVFIYKCDGEIAEVKLIDIKSGKQVAANGSSAAMQIERPMPNQINLNPEGGPTVDPFLEKHQAGVPVEDDITRFKPVKVDAVGDEAPPDGTMDDISAFKPVFNAPPPQ